MIRADDAYDVVVIGAGLAGLSLARQLLLASPRRILMIDRRAELPPRRQKVGEATVQVSGFYFSKVLELEEHLLREHYLKYNLRFWWKTPGRANDAFEDYSQSYIRSFSNVPTYQLDRNAIEAELLRLNAACDTFQCQHSATNIDVRFRSQEPHVVTFEAEGGARTVFARWVVDASGRGRVLARRLGLQRVSPILHGSSFVWVEGLVNLEQFTNCPSREIPRMPIRRHIGHLPFWLATNHFCGEGFWLWVIPLQGRTSLGLVYDIARVSHMDVDTAEKLIAWISREFPLFRRALSGRRVIDHGCFRSCSYDCERAISAERWALSGEAGRFTDPLYSPGGDLIALHNTLIAHAIAGDDASLPSKCAAYDRLMRAWHDAYVPSYAVSYDALGDQRSMNLKYTWELAVYFAMYVFPFINDLFASEAFIATYLRMMARLGRINDRLQAFIDAYYRWRKPRRANTAVPTFHDFTASAELRIAESAFYEVGVSLDEARRVLSAQAANLERLARIIVMQVVAEVVGDATVADDASLRAAIDLDSLRFDPSQMDEWCTGARGTAMQASR
jgi:flavin-dependent dehydrogenase